MITSEFVITSANIFTGLSDRPRVQALGVRDGVIAALGTQEEVRKALPKAEVLELPGRLVTPGLVDGHCHFVHYGTTRLMVDLNGLTSIAACRSRIGEAVAKAEPGQWIIGRGWNHHLWEEGREPCRQDLDDISGDHPLLMIRVCGHSEWVNSKALALAGITRDSEVPSGIRYDRDQRGDLTGLLHEARDIVARAIPAATKDQLLAAAGTAQKDFLRFGLTGLHSCESLEEWDLLSGMDRAGELKLRVHHLFQPHDLERVASRDNDLGWLSGSPHLWLGHLKLFSDGSLGAGTALMHDSYSDEPGNTGIHCLTAEELKAYTARAHELGISVAIHAIGDRGCTHALDAIAHGRTLHPGAERNRVEHVQLYGAGDLARFKEMDVTASVQPVFLSSDWSVAQRRWEGERLCRAYAWKNILEEGIRMQFGTDAPVEPINPLLGLQAAVLRQTPEGKPEGGWRPDQRLSLDRALAGYTRTAAWTSGKEGVLGTLAPGNWADITVFDRDLETVPAEEWHRAAVEMTIIDGRIVYEK